MCSPRMRNLVNNLENDVWMCGNASGKNSGFVDLKTLSSTIVRRAELLREIDLLEIRANRWTVQEAE